MDFKKLKWVSYGFGIFTGMMIRSAAKDVSETKFKNTKKEYIRKVEKLDYFKEIKNVNSKQAEEYTEAYHRELTRMACADNVDTIEDAFTTISVLYAELASYRK